MERRAGRGFSEEKKWTASSICNNLKDFFLKNISRREKENMCRAQNLQCPSRVHSSRCIKHTE